MCTAFPAVLALLSLATATGACDARAQAEAEPRAVPSQPGDTAGARAAPRWSDSTGVELDPTRHVIPERVENLRLASGSRSPAWRAGGSI